MLNQSIHLYFRGKPIEQANMTIFADGVVQYGAVVSARRAISWVYVLKRRILSKLKALLNLIDDSKFSEWYCYVVYAERNMLSPVCLSVRHTGGSVKNG